MSPKQRTDKITHYVSRGGINLHCIRKLWNRFKANRVLRNLLFREQRGNSEWVIERNRLMGVLDNLVSKSRVAHKGIQFGEPRHRVPLVS